MWIESIDTASGKVVVNGVDVRRPSVPVHMGLGDGVVYEGWFPQTHVYLDKSRNYILKVTSHYGDGSSDTEEILIRFIPPRIKPINIPANVSV